MPVQKDSNIVKIAVEMNKQVAQLIEFNQKQPLTGIIQVYWWFILPSTHNYFTTKTHIPIKSFNDEK